MKVRLSINEQIALALAAGLIIVPLFIVPAPNPISNATNNYCKNHEWNGVFGGTHITDWLTLLVLVAQLMVFRRQAKISDKQNEIISRQTDISEQAMTIGQRPFLFVNFHTFITPWDYQATPSSTPSFEFSVSVHGNSPAILRRFHERLVFQETEPPVPTQLDLGWAILDVAKLPGQDWQRTTHYGGDRDLLRGRGVGNRRFFALIAFVYDDVFGNQHEMVFCYVNGRDGSPGMVHGGPAYNYQRTRKPEERI